MRCTGPQPIIALPSQHMAAHKANFTGVAITSSCKGTPFSTSYCLVTICAGRLVLRRSSVTGVRRNVGKDEQVISAKGRLVWVVGDSRVEMRNSRFSMNEYTPLGVYNQSHMLLVASTIANNSVEGDGGGLCLDGGALVTMTGKSTVHGNNATQHGGGLSVRDHAMLTVDGNSSVTANSAVGSGGGLAATGNVTVTLTGGSSVQGNTATGGGGVYAGNGAGVSCTGCIIAHNTAKVDEACEQIISADGPGKFKHEQSVEDLPYCVSIAGGGGLFIERNARVMLAARSSVHNNDAVNGLGGGLYLRWGASVLLTYGSIVMDNAVEAAGGGLAVDSSIVTLSGGSIIQGNTAWLDGGGLHVYNSDVTITGGSAVQGNTAQQSGGGLYLLGSSLTVTGGSHVEGNSAAWSGGGLGIVESSLNLTGGSRVHGNRVLKGMGGGLDVRTKSRVTISNHGTVSNNSCLGGVGGGIAVDTAKPAKFDLRGRTIADADELDYFIVDYEYNILYSLVSISSSTVANNTSNGSAGGGLAVGGYGSVELVDNTVLLRHSAVNSSGGGVVLLSNGTLRADDTALFVNNVVGKGYVGSTIATFGNSSLDLPRGGHLTKCTVGVYLGWSTCKVGETQQHDMCVCCPQHTFSFTNVSCEACPRNGNCSGGSLVQPLPGYWSSAPTSVQII